jgi:hypothetical protein
MFWSLGLGGNLFPNSLKTSWSAAEDISAATLGEHFGENNPVRQTIALYLHAAGLETGYGYFAPNVPDNSKLVFEFHFADGRVEYSLPRVGSEATGLRLADLFDNIRYTVHPELRELLIRMLAYSAWEEHPDATMVRAIFGTINLPTIGEFRAGKKETYDVLSAYDFSFKRPGPKH